MAITAGNDFNTLTGSGTGTFDFLGGLDVLSLGTSLRSTYTVSQSGGTISVDTASGASAPLHLKLLNTERLTFNNNTDKYAFDLDGNAGIAAKILGAVLGASAVSNTSYAGIALSYLDAGTSYEGLMQAALTATGATTNSAVVTKLMTNLLGSVPSADQIAPYVAMLDNGSMTAGALGVAAADLSLNTNNINLVGLQSTGLHYV